MEAGGRAEADGGGDARRHRDHPEREVKSIPGPIFATAETVRSHVDGLPLWDSHPG